MFVIAFWEPQFSTRATYAGLQTPGDSSDSPLAGSTPATGPHWTLSQPWWSFRQARLFSFVSDVPPIVVVDDGMPGSVNRRWASQGSSYFGVTYLHTASVGVPGEAVTPPVGDTRRIISQDRTRYVHRGGFVSRPSEYPREISY